MIDFRYHLVSIVAIFLALSLGLLLGSTELRPYVQKGLNGLSKTQHNEIESLLGQKAQLQGQIGSANIVFDNNEIMAASQLMTAKQSCKDSIGVIQKEAAAASIHDKTDETAERGDV